MYLGANGRANHRIWIKLNHAELYAINIVGFFQELLCVYSLCCCLRANGGKFYQKGNGSLMVDVNCSLLWNYSAIDI